MPGITFSEASGVNDSIYGKSQAPIRMFLESRGEAFESASMIPHLFAMDTSKNWAEMYTSLTAMDGFKPVGENGAYPVDEMQEGFSKTLKHMTWKDSFSISREMVDDAKAIDMKKKPAGFIKGYYRTREKFGSALFAGAVSGASTITYEGKTFDATTADGKSLFNVGHLSKIDKAKKQSNMFADAFSVDALGAIESKMQDFRGDNDDILDIAPNTILIPNDYTLKRDVFAAIGADKDPATANNGFNYQYGRWNVIVWPYLNQYLDKGIKPWILLDSDYNEEYGGAVWLDRVSLEVKSRIDEGTDANIWSGYARFIAGFNDWRFAAIGGMAGGTELL